MFRRIYIDMLPIFFLNAGRQVWFPGLYLGWHRSWQRASNQLWLDARVGCVWRVRNCNWRGGQQSITTHTHHQHPSTPTGKKSLWWWRFEWKPLSKPSPLMNAVTSDRCQTHGRQSHQLTAVTLNVWVGEKSAVSSSLMNSMATKWVTVKWLHSGLPHFFLLFVKPLSVKLNTFSQCFTF